VISVRSRLGVISPVVVFAAFGVLYGLPYALTYLAGGTFLDERDYATRRIPEALWLHGIAIGSTIGGYLFALSTTRPAVPSVPRNDIGASWCDSSLRLVAAIAAGLGVLGVLLFLATAVGVTTLQGLSYGNRGLAMRGYGLLLNGLHLFGIAALLLYYDAVVAKQRGRARFVLAAAGSVLAAWMLISLSRGALIRFLVSVAVVRSLAGHRLTRTQALIGGLVLTAATLLHSSIGRQVSLEVVAQIDWRALPLFVLNPASGEFGSTMPTVADVLAWFPAARDFRWGASYIEAIGVLVPQVIWPGRPLPAGEAYAADLYGSVWEQGGAYGFSPIAEAYMNFGAPGVVIVFFVTGLLLCMTEYAILRRPLGHRAFLYALAVPWLAFYWRNDWASVLKNYFLLTVGVVYAMRVVAGAVRSISLSPGSMVPVADAPKASSL
jgi:oligosaccharide repeat unit polymerase